MTTRDTTPDAGARRADSILAEYERSLADALRDAGVPDPEAEARELCTYVRERVPDDAWTPESVAAAIAELGDPAAIAADAADATDAAAGRAEAGTATTPLAGTVLGVPYDLRPPTVARVARTWWDPLDERVLVPRVFGAGWSLNFGALAVRVGLIAPDDEDEPFACARPAALWAVWACAAAVVAAFSVGAAATWGDMPARIATHYDLAGRADEFSDTGTVLLITLGVAWTSVVWALVAQVRRRAPRSRAAGAAAALFVGVLTTGMYAQGLATARGAEGAWIVEGAVVLALLAPFVMLVTLARSGRAGEMRRDAAGRDGR